MEIPVGNRRSGQRTNVRSDRRPQVLVDDVVGFKSGRTGWGHGSSLPISSTFDSLLSLCLKSLPRRYMEGTRGNKIYL